MELSSKTKQVENGHDKTPTSNFEKAVEESREKIRSTTRTEPKVRPKGKVGRPRKIEGNYHGPESKTERPGLETQAPTPPPDISKFLKVPLIALSQIPATKNKIPELALSSDEAEAVAQSFNQILEAFIPDVGQMSPKTAAVISAAVVVGSIGFQKYQVYAAVQEQRWIEANKQPENPKESAAPQGQGAAV